MTGGQHSLIVPVLAFAFAILGVSAAPTGVLSGTETGRNAAYPATTPVDQGSRLLSDPVTGADVRRISGQPGAVIAFRDPQSRPGEWKRRVKNRYVTDSAWNIDGTLLHLLNIRADAPLGNGTHLILDGATYEPIIRPNYPVGVYPEGKNGSFRWSQDPDKPTIEYLFPSWNSLDQSIIAFDVLSNSTVRRVLRLPFAHNTLGGKGSIAYVAGQEFAALLGKDDMSQSSDAWVYLVNLSSGELVGDPFNLTNSDCGAVRPAVCKQPYLDSLRFSPDGEHLLFYYLGSSAEDRSWRLLDVSLSSAGANINSHRLPAIDCRACSRANAAKGHFPTLIAHPIFAYGSDGNTVNVVAGNVSWYKKKVDQVTALNERGYLGRVIAFNTATNKWRALTDPLTSDGIIGEAPVSHISTNLRKPGYVFVSYQSYVPDAGFMEKYSGKIVALDLGDPKADEGTMEIVSHHSDISCGNDCFVNMVSSPDGERLLFSSTWESKSPQASTVATYVTNIPRSLYTDP